jgi:hypothetical protein
LKTFAYEHLPHEQSLAVISAGGMDQQDWFALACHGVFDMSAAGLDQLAA